MLLICCALGQSGRAAIMISEIMYNPQGTDLDTTVVPNVAREWVELYNNGSLPADLSGWQFGDSQDNDWATPFPTGTTLGAGQALIVTGDALTFDANWGSGINRIQVGSFPTLANSPSPTNETAALRNNVGAVQDFVNFDDENGWPTASGSDGNSIYVLPGGLTATANDVGSNWHPSSAGAYGARWVNGGSQGENHGSPGYVATVAQTPFAPSPNAAWSMVVLPDTQNYSKSSVNLPIFSQLTSWIRDHRADYKIQLVLQEGDIVNQNSQATPTSGDQTADQQWVNARAAMSILDGHVPYVMAVGNHDLGTTSAQDRSTQFNDFFNVTQNPLVDPTQGGILKGVYETGKLENAYFELQAPDGRKLLLFSLEFWPRQEVVDWANRIASQPKYADHSAALLTHSYLNWNGSLMNADPSSYGVGGDSHDGLQLWNELVKVNENFEMTFSGHVGGDGVAYLKGTGVEGNKVHQMLINSQFETNGGNGWMRILEFLDDGKTVHVRTYSPFLGLARTDPANDYYIEVTQLNFQPADFNHDGSVDVDDLSVWKSNFGAAAASSATGDADGDHLVTGADFLAWQRQLGLPAAAASGAAIPEPAAAALALAAAVATAGTRALTPSRRRPARSAQRSSPVR
jgi:hypothetical protein